MTVDERFEQLERKTQRLEKRNKRLTVALTMAATGDKDGVFDRINARTIFVENDAGEIVVAMGASVGGDGQVSTQSAKGKPLVDLTATVKGEGMVDISSQRQTAGGAGCEPYRRRGRDLSAQRQRVG